MSLSLENCPFDVEIKFRTIVGWLIGKKHKIMFSNGEYTSFFISSKINENKHWATFTEHEIYDIKIINTTNNE